jgi:hypothetical protein
VFISILNPKRAKIPLFGRPDLADAAPLYLDPLAAPGDPARAILPPRSRCMYHGEMDDGAEPCLSPVFPLLPLADGL